MAKVRGNRRRETIEGYLFISPWLLGILLFTVGPIIASIYISFTDWNTFQSPNWVGLENYKHLWEDPMFWKSLKNTFYFAILSVPLGIAGSLAVAVLLNQKVWGMRLFRTLYYLPAVVSGVAVALLWKWILDPEFGMINLILSKIGIDGPNWLADPNWVIPSYVLMSLWGIGGGMVTYLAGLQDVPKQLYESAQIDGANSWQCFWKITLPILSPVIFFNLVMGIIGSLKVFTQSYIMGGAGGNGTFYLVYLWQNAFSYLKMGYASALAWVLFLIILVLTLLVFKSSPLWVYYEGEKKRG